MTDESTTEPTTTEPSTTDTGTPRSRKKIVAAGAGAAVVAVLAGGSAFAYSQLSGGGLQPHDVMPSSMQMYSRLDLDPSASQKIELFQLLRKIPDAAKELGDAEDTDLRELMFSELSSACDDVDYSTDIEPWLGKRIGVGADLGKEQFLVAAQVTDEGKARAGIDALAACSDQEIGIAFTEGYALISDQQKTVDAAIDATAKESLGERPDFVRTMDDLGEQGIASVWFDGKSLTQSLPKLGLPADQTDQLADLEKIGSAAMVLRVDGSAIELAGVSDLSTDVDLPAAPIGDLPADTVLALSLAGLGERVGPQFETILEQFDALTPQTTSPSPSPEVEPLDDETLALLDPETRKIYEDMLEDTPSSTSSASSAEEAVEAFESETGLSLPDDLATLLGESITLAVGSSNLDTIATSEGPRDLADLDIAIRTQGDGPAIREVMDTLAGLASDSGQKLFTESTDDGAVLATNAKAAKAVLGNGTLGEQEAFASVMPFGEDTSQAMFVDIGSVLETIRDSEPPQEVLDGLQQVESLNAAGISVARTDDDTVGFSLRVSFQD